MIAALSLEPQAYSISPGVRASVNAVLHLDNLSADGVSITLLTQISFLFLREEACCSLHPSFLRAVVSVLGAVVASLIATAVTVLQKASITSMVSQGAEYYVLASLRAHLVGYEKPKAGIIKCKRKKEETVCTALSTSFLQSRG